MFASHDRKSAALVTSRRAVLLGVGAVLLDAPTAEREAPAADLVEIVPAAKTSTVDAVKAFIGNYKFVGGPQERAALARAIDALVDKMSIFARGIARDKLTETNPIAATISFAADTRVLTTRFEKRAFTAPLDGRPAQVTAISGDTMEMRYRISDDEIRQWIAGDEKGQVNTFRLKEQRVVQHVRVYASQLPADLIYKLTYERV
jgi:hypothetical protein